MDTATIILLILPVAIWSFYFGILLGERMNNDDYNEGYRQGVLDNHNSVMSDTENEYVKEMKKIHVARAQKN